MHAPVPFLVSANAFDLIAQFVDQSTHYNEPTVADHAAELLDLLVARSLPCLARLLPYQSWSSHCVAGTLYHDFYNCGSINY